MTNIKGKVKYVLLTSFIVIFVIALFKLLFYFYKSHSENVAFTLLREKVSVVEHKKIINSDGEVALSDVSIEIFPKEQTTVQKQLSNLYEQNSDLAGWIKIDDTQIDYPVMFTPNDPEFYLKKSFDKNTALSGTPFIGKGCTIDPLSDNIIIYAHNMKNGTMFSDLLKYKNETYRTEHRQVQFDTIFAEGNYEIIWAFYIDVSQGNNHFPFYKYQDLSGTARKEFVDSCQKMSLYGGNAALTGDEQFLTLVTCSYHVENGRFVVIAKTNNS